MPSFPRLARHCSFNLVPFRKVFPKVHHVTPQKKFCRNENCREALIQLHKCMCTLTLPGTSVSSSTAAVGCGSNFNRLRLLSLKYKG